MVLLAALRCIFHGKIKNAEEIKASRVARERNIPSLNAGPPEQLKNVRILYIH